MTIDDWRAQYHGLSAKVERLQKHEAWAQYRLAAVEAERDAALKRAAEARETADNYAGHCNKACKQLEAVEAELDAARAGEARAVEALDVFARAYRVSMLPFAPGIDEADGAHHWMPHGWPSVADFKLANSVLSDSSALAWLAKQRAEAAAEALEGIAKENGTDGGKAYYASVVYREFPDRLTMRIGVVEAGDLMMRAAALRAGAKGGVDA